MVGGLGGVDLVERPSQSLFASSYPFWEMVGGTMFDIAIGSVALLVFLFVTVVTLGAVSWLVLVLWDLASAGIEKFQESRCSQ